MHAGTICEQLAYMQQCVKMITLMLKLGVMFLVDSHRLHDNASTVLMATAWR